jgi:hypothetical protein
MSLPIYSTGTVSVAAGGTTVTGAGVMWTGVNVKQGDFISINGLAEVLITEVTDAANLKIPPWLGAAQSNVPYVVYQTYVGRVVGVAAAEDVGVMLEKLHVDGLPFIVGADETVPDPSYGDEGQLAFRPSTGEWWVKQGGVWVHSAGLTALGYGGTSATSILIATGPASFTTQGSLAYNGARVRAASSANLNNWMEGVAAYSGTNLNMTADKIGGSGTHADWLFSIAGQPGTNGTGFGDMLAANNLSELTATAPTARKNIYAAPFDALAYNGMQINGSMDVSQEIGGTGKDTVGYAADGWGTSFSAGFAAKVWSQQRVDGPPGLPFSYRVTATTGVPTLAAADRCEMYSPIEGYRMARLAWSTASAQPITIGFWSSHTKTGLYSVGVRNGPQDVKYIATYTQVASAVWQYNTVTIPGPTSGSFPTNNAAGMWVMFSFAAGTSQVAAPGSWSSGAITAATGQVNGLSANGDFCCITGVVVLPGLEAPSAARSALIMRPFDQELLTCQRYFRPMPFDGSMYVTSATNVSFNINYNMRSAPVIIPTVNLLGIYANGADRVQSAVSCVAAVAFSPIIGMVTCSNFTGLVAGGTAVRSGNLSFIIANLDARL